VLESCIFSSIPDHGILRFDIADLRYRLVSAGLSQARGSLEEDDALKPRWDHARGNRDTSTENADEGSEDVEDHQHRYQCRGRNGNVSPSRVPISNSHSCYHISSPNREEAEVFVQSVHKRTENNTN
jgi:hypothetical protein